MKDDIFEKLVLNPIQNSIKTFADKCAFCINGKLYSYQELGNVIERQRERYKRSKNNLFPIEIHDDIKTYASIIALWMEKKGYVPINPNHPQDRNNDILKQVEIANKEDIDSLAYILFTSGSTGTPKGVCITRENVGYFMDSFWKTGITVTENDRCLQCFDLTFDVSIQSFLAALTRGACVYTVPTGQVKYLSVAALIQEKHITFGAMAPSLLAYLRPYFEELDASSIKTCILTAEACPIELIKEWRQCAINADIYDFYGPTEGTIYCTYYHCKTNKNILADNGIVSIGKPLTNVDAIILNEQGIPTTIPEDKGELCISGGQVTIGYLNNPDKNETSFSTIEYNGSAKRFYHTGDLAYWDKSGNLMYLGRIDQQAKIQGFRVELTEIEYHARQFYDNKVQTAAIVFQNKQNLNEIALFVEKESESADSLIKFLRSQMPSYMIPTKVVFIDRFPLNNNDKLDRTILKSLI